MKIFRAVSLIVALFSCSIQVYAQDARSLSAEMLKAASIGDESRVVELKAQIDLLTKPERGDRKKARSLNESALKQLSENNLDGAAKTFEEASQIDRSDPEILNNLGYALMKSKKYNLAQNVCFDTLALAPGRTSAWVNLGESFAQQGDQLNAIAAFDIAYSFSQNKEKTKEFLQTLIAKPDSSSILVTAVTAALKHEGVRGASVRPEPVTQIGTSNVTSPRAMATVPQATSAVSSMVQDIVHRCALIQVPADRTACWKSEAIQKNKELDDLKAKYRITDLVIPLCRGIKVDAYDECRATEISKAIETIKNNIADRAAKLAEEQQAQNQAQVAPLNATATAVVASAAQDSSVVQGSLPLALSTTGNLTQTTIASGPSSPENSNGFFTQIKDSTSDFFSKFYQSGLRLFLVLFLVSPVIAVYLHRKGLLIIYSSYTDAVFTSLLPILFLGSIVFAFLLSKMIQFVIDLDSQAQGSIMIFVMLSLMSYGVYLVIKETYLSNGLSWRFLVSLSAKILLVFLFYFALVLVFAGRRKQYATETHTEYEKYQNKSLILAMLATSAFGALMSYVSRDDRFVPFLDYLRPFGTAKVYSEEQT